MVSYARKYDVSENFNHYRLDGIRYKIRENVSTRKGHIGLDARKFNCAKIFTFTVYCYANVQSRATVKCHHFILLKGILYHFDYSL